MATFRWNNLLAVLVLITIPWASGCATVDQRADILYQSSANAKGGSGDLYLADAVRPNTGGATGVQWVLGAIRDKDGEKVGSVVTETAPADTILDAFRQEFKAAGYKVLTAGSLPEGVKKGVVLSAATITLDETRSFFTVDAKCSAKISVEPWRDGKALNKLDYEIVYADSTVTDRDELPAKTLQKALQLLMSRATPEIVKLIEQK